MTFQINALQGSVSVRDLQFNDLGWWFKEWGARGAGGGWRSSGLEFLAWWGQGACPSLSNRREWSCPLFLLLSRTVHLLAAPCNPQSWPGTVGLFGEGDPDGPSCCLSAALDLSDSLYPQLSLTSSGSPELRCSPFLRHSFTTSARKPLHIGALDPAWALSSLNQSHFFFFSAMLHSMQDLSFLTRDGTWPPVVEKQTFNHWPTREVPPEAFLSLSNATLSLGAPGDLELLGASLNPSKVWLAFCMGGASPSIHCIWLPFWDPQMA